MAKMTDAEVSGKMAILRGKLVADARKNYKDDDVIALTEFALDVGETILLTLLGIERALRQIADEGVG